MKAIRFLTVRPEGTKVLVNINHDTFLEMEWDKAAEVAAAIFACAKRAEEQAQAETIARDQGLLLRAGVPLGLTNDPRIRDEAAKLAAWDGELRRALPGGVQSQEHFGTPTILKH